jgi:hypothetical protein
MNPALLHFFADAPGNCNSAFFGIPSWYQYLPAGDFKGCNVDTLGTTPADVFGVAVPIALAATEIALYIAGMVAVGYIIFGGVKFVISQGEPEKTKGARNTIINALVGLVIATLAIAIVKFIGASL